MEKSFTPIAGIEFLQGLEFVIHFSSSAQLRQLRFHFVEIRHYARVIVTIDVLDEASTINDKGCALWHTAHSQPDLREKGLVDGIVDAGDLVFIVAQEWHYDSFLPGPGFLGERIVPTDSVNRGVHLSVGGKVRADTTHFGRARARKRHWEKCQQSVSFAEIFAQGDLLRSICRFRGQSEIRSFCSNREWHGRNSV
jgi:hypothetical protein